MTPQEMKERTLEFGLRVMRLVSAMPQGRASDVVARQLVRCATSVGANYRGACRSRSDADFLARMGVVEEEADEALYWLQVVRRSGLMDGRRLRALEQEGQELLSIVVASIRTVKNRVRKRPAPQSEIRNPKSEMP
jgi:four helix bundle protein